MIQSENMQAVLAFVAIQSIMLMSSINSTAISVAFPDIIAAFDTSLVLAGWVLSIYQLVAASFMVIMGKLSDILGRKKTFIICSGLFFVGSLLAALAPNIYFLIAARFIQSVGGGGLFPSMTGMVFDLFPRHRLQAIGVGMSIFNIGGIIGPNIGSWLVTSFGWQWIFWINIPIGIVALIPIFFLVKSDSGKKSRIDFAGAGYLAAFLFTFMIGLSELANITSGTGWLIVGLLFAISAFSIGLFIRHEFKAKEPIIELDLLRMKPFAASNAYNIIFGACLFGFSSFIPLYVVTVYQMSTLESGYVLMARAIGAIVAATAGSVLLSRWGFHKPMLLGSIIVIVSLLFLGLEFTDVITAGTGISPLVLISAASLLMGVGIGVANPSSSVACLDLMPQRASTITGIGGMFRMGSGAIAIAVITLILQFVGDMSFGFNLVFIGTALITLLTIPFIFAMPDKPAPAPASEKK